MTTRDEFREAISELIAVTVKVKEFSWGNFLQDSVYKNADEETLEKIIADIRSFIAQVESQ